MATESVTFPGADGTPLAGRLERPDRAPVATAVFAHCFTCTKDLRASVLISRGLAALGIATLRFDFTGLGDSEGDFGQTTFTSSVGDLLAAAAWLESQVAPPSLLVGHSLGGAAVLRAAPRLSGVRAVVAIGAPADPSHATALFGPALSVIEQDGEAEVQLGPARYRISRALVDDLRAADAGAALGTLGAALLLLHSPHDATVPIAEAARNYQRARHPKSFISLDDADHLLSRARDAEYAARLIAVWSSHYVEP